MAEHGDPGNRAELLLTLMGLRHEVAELPLARTAHGLGELPFTAVIKLLADKVPMAKIELGLNDQEAPETVASAQVLVDTLSAILDGTDNSLANEALLALSSLVIHAENMRNDTAEAQTAMNGALVAVELAANAVKHAQVLVDLAREAATDATADQAEFDRYIASYIDGIV